MRWTSILAIYFLLWVLCAFIVLPLGIRSHEETGHKKVPGQADGAPANFSPGKVIVRATALSLVICALFVLNYNRGWITFRDIDFFDSPQDAGPNGGAG